MTYATSVIVSLTISLLHCFYHLTHLTQKFVSCTLVPNLCMVNQWLFPLGSPAITQYEIILNMKYYNLIMVSSHYLRQVCWKSFNHLHSSTSLISFSHSEALSNFTSWKFFLLLISRTVTELRFSCSSPKDPIQRDKCWVKGKIALLGKLAILERRWAHVPKNQLPLANHGARTCRK